MSFITQSCSNCFDHPLRVPLAVWRYLSDKKEDDRRWQIIFYLLFFIPAKGYFSGHWDEGCYTDRSSCGSDVSIQQSLSWEQGCALLLLLRGVSPLCWLSVPGLRARGSTAAAAAPQSTGSRGRLQSCLLWTYAILNMKYLCLAFFFFFFSQHVKEEALLIDFSAIFLWHMPWHCSTDAITSSMVQKYSFSKLCDCSQDARTSHNYSKRSVEENHALKLYLEEVSMCNFTFISACSNLLQQFLLVRSLDMVLVNCCAGLCSDGTASPCLV